MAHEIYTEQMTTPLGGRANVRSPIYRGIKDPRNGGAIPTNESGFIALVTEGAAETRELPDPQFIGEELMLFLRIDGGDCVITAANGVNQAGNTVLTFGDAGDVVLLVAILVGSDLRWRVAFNDGVGLA